MSVREFTDSNGIEWRAWDVTPEHMHPATRSEDFMSNLQDGWLTFESATDKRRLAAPYPSDWTTYRIPDLEALCARAKSVTRRTQQSETGKQRAIVASQSEQKAIRSANASRTFRSPRGREWTVRVHECLDREGADQMVLRFTADDIIVELMNWPADWQSASVEDFALMLLDANPPRRRKKGDGPQRRYDDHFHTGDMGAADTAPSAR
ncbi:MAG TPA: hypothetical protein VF034_03300 [Gemmatimonadaceae bacterium]